MQKQTDNSYSELLNGLKNRIPASQVKAALAVNLELMHLYWHIGHEILIRQEKEGSSAKVIERLARDLKSAFPQIAGFSQSNLKYMRLFAHTYNEHEITQCCVDQLPWEHNITLITALATNEERSWYAHKALENGWGKDMLVLQIESQLFERQNAEISSQ